jgi:hypothetical protein
MTTIRTVLAGFLTAVMTAIVATPGSAARLQLSPSQGEGGTIVTAVGVGFPARKPGAILVRRMKVARFRTNARGRFDVTFRMPERGPAGVRTVEAVVARARAESRFLALTWWRPARQLTWYWQLQGAVRVKPVQATDFDGFDNTVSTVASFHARGQRAICYIDVGTWEKWRPDAASFPSSVLGRNNGWPGERWLDIRKLSALAPIMTRRLTMCQRKGFDAVEPDNIDGWENSTGFRITGGEQLTYDRWIAAKAHSLGLAVLQKNDPEQAAALQPSFDGALDEQCNEYGECSLLKPYLAAGKPVLNAEYAKSRYPGFCTADHRSGIMGALFDQALDGVLFRACW